MKRHHQQQRQPDRVHSVALRRFAKGYAERYAENKTEMKIDYDKVHDQCGWHEDAILKSSKCGCFYCLSIFPSHEITEWIDEPADCPRGPGKTAICPHCGVDSVLQDTIDYELTKEFLEMMRDRFFK